MKTDRPTGFTLIELMIVVTIIGILATIAVPRFAELIRKATEGSSKGNLGAMRSALSIYYGDMEGVYPDRLAALTVAGKYLTAIPLAKTPRYHPDSSAESNGATAVLGDGGGWFYDNATGDGNYGAILVSCTHTDTKGSVWTLY